MNAHFTTLMAIDFDKHAAAAYAENFPGVDVRCATVESQIADLPSADIIIGGPPCQGFSVAGEGKGEHDERNGWPAFIGAVAKVKPRMFIAENEEGLKVRRLTPDECARLMSMPDSFRWPDKITKTAKYKIIGNGQCSLMVHHLAQALRRADPESRTVISLFCGGGVGDSGLHGRFWALSAESHPT